MFEGIDVKLMRKFPECPVYDPSCPYCSQTGICKMYEEEGCLPYDECDAFYGLEEEEEEEE